MDKPLQPTLFDDNIALRYELVSTNQIMPGKKKKLIKSVARAGVLQSILLYPLSKHPDGYQYEIIDGEGRHYSALQAGISHIPCLIAEGVNRDQAMAMRTIANIDRGANIVAEARAIKHIIDTGKYANISAAATDLEIDASTLKKRLKLTELPDDVLDGVFEGKITPKVLEDMARLSKEYREKAVSRYRETTTEEKGRFTQHDLKDIRIKRQDDLGTDIMTAIQDIPAALPLLELSPIQLMSEDIRRRCSERDLNLAELITELSRHLSPEEHTPTNINPERHSINPGANEAEQREEDKRNSETETPPAEKNEGHSEHPETEEPQKRSGTVTRTTPQIDSSTQPRRGNLNVKR